MQEYIILRDANVEERKVFIRELGRYSGATATIPNSELESRTLIPEPVITKKKLDGQDLREAISDPDVIGVAKVMPTKLMEPVQGKTIKSKNNVAWGIAAVGASLSPYTGQGIIPCVLDTGIDNNHPAFTGVELVQKDFSASGNGDVNGHGTHCAGTIFGRDVNGTRIGVARGIDKAYIGKVLGDNGSGTTTMLYEGMKWADTMEANIISISLGFDVPGWVESMVNQGYPADLAASIGLEDFIRNGRLFDSFMDMLRAKSAFGGGTLVVGASGNESKRDINEDYEVGVAMPSAALGVISVGAVQPSNNGYVVANFSNTNPTVTAPGVGVLSAQANTSGLVSLSGTSMATPHVAGLAALWWQKMNETAIPNKLTAVRARLIATARPDVFASTVDVNDRGAGLAYSPE